MVDLYIDIEDNAGQRQGSGPITSASRWRTVARMSKAGAFEFEMPAADPKAFAVQKKRIARAYALVGGQRIEVGAGIIDHIVKVPQPDGKVTLQVSGDDLIRELTYRSVLNLKLYTGGNPVSHSAAVAAVAGYAPAGWTITPDSAPANDSIYGYFNGETVLQGLIKVAEKSQNHFYRGAGRSLNFASSFTPSGVRAIQARGELSPATCAILSLTEQVDTYDLLTRIYPRGSGNANVQLTLRATSRVAPAGYTLNAAENYIEHNASVATYGIIERQVDYREIGPIENTDADIVAASNALFDAALETLKRQSTELEQATYALQITGCSQLLRPMQSIRLVYRDLAAGLNINSDLNILEATWEVTTDAVQTVGLVVSNADRWPKSDVGLIADSLQEGHVYQALPQLNANSYVTGYTKNVDVDNIAAFRFRLGGEVTQLQQVLFEFQLLPFESTVKSVGGTSGGSGTISTDGPSTNTSGNPSNDTSGAPSTNTSGTPSTDTSGAPSTNTSGAPSTNTSGAAVGNTGAASGNTGAASGDTGSPSTNTSGVAVGDTGAASGNTGGASGNTDGPSVADTAGPSTNLSGQASGSTGQATGNTDTPSVTDTAGPSTNLSGQASGSTGQATGNTDTPSDNESTGPSNNNSQGPSTNETGGTQGGDTDEEGNHVHGIPVFDQSGNLGTVTLHDAGGGLYFLCNGLLGGIIEFGSRPAGHHNHSLSSHTHSLNNHTHGMGFHTHSLNNHTHGLNNHTHSLNSHTHSLNNHTHSLNNHTHGLNNHTHSLNSHTHSLNSHTHSLNSHTHGLNNHTHSLNDHTHSLASHTHSLSGHTHGLNNHTHSLNDHTHSLASHTHSLASHTHTLGNHTHSLNNHTHDLGNHTHDLGNHTHDLSESISAVYGIFRDDVENTYEVDELEYRVNGGSWNSLASAVDAGNNWWQIDITNLVMNSTTFRPLQTSNLLEIQAADDVPVEITAIVDAIATFSQVFTDEPHHVLQGDMVTIVTDAFGAVEYEVFSVASETSFLVNGGPEGHTGTLLRKPRLRATIDAQLSVRSVIQAIAFA